MSTITKTTTKTPGMQVLIVVTDVSFKPCPLMLSLEYKTLKVYNFY